MSALSVPLLFTALEAVPRRGEPVTVGLPWPRGAIHDDNYFTLIGPDGSSQVLQTQVLDRWPDGGIRWCLFDFLATWDGVAAETYYRISISDTPRVFTHLANNDSSLPGHFLYLASDGYRATGIQLDKSVICVNSGPI